MEIETTMRYYLISVRMAITKKPTNNKCWRRCGEKETLLHCWWECKWIQPLWRTVWRVPPKLKTGLPHDPAIPLLYIYLDKMKAKTQKDSYALVFIAALFTTAKTWKQTEVPINR